MTRTLNKSAFTLIELLVSAGIIVLMLTVSLPAFLNFQRKQNFHLAAELVRDILVEAETDTLAPRSGDAQGIGKLPGADYYRAVFSGTNQYQVDEQTNVSTGLNDARFDLALKQGQLPNGVSYCVSSTSPELLIDASNLDVPPKGAIFAISRSGRMVSPSETGRYRIVLAHSGIRGTLKSVEIQAETGQVSITDLSGNCS